MLSRTTIAMGQLFFIASASAAAMIFLAASRLIRRAVRHRRRRCGSSGPPERCRQWHYRRRLLLTTARSLSLFMAFPPSGVDLFFPRAEAEITASRSARHFRKALSVAAELHPWLGAVADRSHRRLYLLGSSSVPAMIIVTSGMTSASSTIGDRIPGRSAEVALPLSPRPLNVCTVPCTLSAGVGTATTMLNAVPVPFDSSRSDTRRQKPARHRPNSAPCRTGIHPRSSSAPPLFDHSKSPCVNQEMTASARPC